MLGRSIIILPGQRGSDQKPMAGWGEYLQSHLDSQITVVNRAVNGRSTKSFLEQGRLADIMREFQPGDYLFIQFGHNDQKVEDPERYTHPGGEYRQNLHTFIHAARQLGGYPVLLTPVSRRRYIPSGELDPLAVGEYPEAMRQTAIETDTPLLDIFAASQSLYHRLGRDESKKLFMHLPAGASPNYPDGIEDDTHFCEEGAEAIARLVIEAMEQAPGLALLKSHIQKRELQ